MLVLAAGDGCCMSFRSSPEIGERTRRSTCCLPILRDFSIVFSPLISTWILTSVLIGLTLSSCCLCPLSHPCYYLHPSHPFLHLHCCSRYLPNLLASLEAPSRLYSVLNLMHFALLSVLAFLQVYHEAYSRLEKCL